MATIAQRRHPREARKNGRYAYKDELYEEEVPSAPPLQDEEEEEEEMEYAVHRDRAQITLDYLWTMLLIIVSFFMITVSVSLLLILVLWLQHGSAIAGSTVLNAVTHGHWRSWIGMFIQV